MPETIQWEIPDEGYERVEKLEEISEEIQRMIDDTHWDKHVDEFVDDDEDGWYETYDPDETM